MGWVCGGSFVGVGWGFFYFCFQVCVRLLPVFLEFNLEEEVSCGEISVSYYEFV